jgi:hypothetical protein
MNGIDTLLAMLYRLRAPLEQVLSDDASIIFNFPNRVANRSEREEVLLTALRSGLVRVRSDDKITLREDDVRQFITSRFSNLLPGKAEVELTGKGGALWEKKASPLWEYFVDETAARTLRGHVWIFFEARSRDWLVCVDQTLRRYGFFPGSDRRITARPNWHPVYWKTFSRGYSLGIDTGERSDSELGTRFTQGIAAANERLANTFSVLAAIWDAEWIAALLERRKA